MPRPSRNLTRISVYLPESDVEALDRIAEAIHDPDGEYQRLRSDLIREAVENYVEANKATV